MSTIFRPEAGPKARRRDRRYRRTDQLDLTLLGQATQFRGNAAGPVADEVTGTCDPGPVATPVRRLPATTATAATATPASPCPVLVPAGEPEPAPADVADRILPPRHWRGLDGLRGLAVLAVVIYHFSGATLPGGFLGVDIFFVLSGYLITRLLVTELLTTGRLNVKVFYRRRARRLLPALAVVLTTVTAAALIWRDQLATIRPAVISTALFSSNWWLAWNHESYFVATGRPSMLQHLWSLGVEEQFYLLWPLLIAATLALTARSRLAGSTAQRRVMPLVAVAVALSLGSTLLMWLLASAWQVPYGNDGSTLYYGTDTHSMGLLLGSALGAVMAGRALTPTAAPARPSSRWVGPLNDVIAASALLAVWWAMAHADQYSPALYRGGFLVVAALVCLIIVVVGRSDSAVGDLLESRPMRWLGSRSYSLYLWHWPIAVVTRPGVDTTMPTWLDQLLRIALTVALSEATYRWVESPTRRLGVGPALREGWHRLRTVGVDRRRDPRCLLAGSLALLGLVAVGVLVIGPSAPAPAAATTTGVGGQHLALSSNPPAHHPVGHSGSGRSPRRLPPHHPAPATTPPGQPTGVGTSSAHPLTAISGFGDSVLLGARQALGHDFPGGTVDAVEGRQAAPILADIDAAARAGQLNPTVIIHIGNNGLIDPSELTETLRLLHSTPLVLVLTDHVDRPWQGANNATINRVVPRFPNAHIINWNAIAGAHRSWLYPDDLHLQPRGATAYAHLLVVAARSY